MKIDRSNYEIYFLDYLDGNLPNEQVDDFLDFLKNNPELHDELKAVSSVKLLDDQRVFPNKNALLKNELAAPSTFDYLAVAYLENDLREEDRQTFLDQIAEDPEKEEAFHLFQKTKLQPDKKIQFYNKKSLRRSEPLKVVIQWGSRVAALLILLWGVWSVWDFSPAPETKLVQVDKKMTTKPIVSEKKPVQSKQEEITALPPTSQTTQFKPLISQLAKNSGQLAVKSPEVQREPVPEPLKLVEARAVADPAERNIVLANMIHYEAIPSGHHLPEELSVEEFLAQKILHKPKDGSLDVTALLTAGLKAVSDVSNDRLEYETNQSGKISEISLNTRMLAFSFPFRKNK